MTLLGDPWRGPVAAAIAAGRPPSDPVLADLELLSRDRLGSTGAARAADAVRERLLGLGPLASLVSREGVTDVLVNGDGSLWTDAGDGARRVGTLDPRDVRPLAVRLASLAGRRLDDAQPFVDGMLPGRVRLHAVLPPLVDGGPHVSLRVPRVGPDGVGALMRIGAVGPELAAVLRAAIAARLSLLVSGGTGSGKTTVLAGLLGECPSTERLVIVEDVRELTPTHPHVVSLQCRPPNVEGAGAITMTDLVRQSLRMRPDRVIVGEVRGAEVRELLVALNTGHEGGGGTIHANSAADLPARCEALGALAGMDRTAVHAQLRGAIQLAVHTQRVGRVRSVVSLGVLAWEAGEVVVHDAVRAPVEGSPRPGPGWPALRELLHTRRPPDAPADLPWSG